MAREPLKRAHVSVFQYRWAHARAPTDTLATRNRRNTWSVKQVGACDLTTLDWQKRQTDRPGRRRTGLFFPLQQRTFPNTPRKWRSHSERGSLLGLARRLDADTRSLLDSRACRFWRMSELAIAAIVSPTPARVSFVSLRSRVWGGGGSLQRWGDASVSPGRFHLETGDKNGWDGRPPVFSSRAHTTLCSHHGSMGVCKTDPPKHPHSPKKCTRCNSLHTEEPSWNQQPRRECMEQKILQKWLILVQKLQICNDERERDGSLWDAVCLSVTERSHSLSVFCCSVTEKM